MIVQELSPDELLAIIQKLLVGKEIEITRTRPAISVHRDSCKAVTYAKDVATFRIELAKSGFWFHPCIVTENEVQADSPSGMVGPITFRVIQGQ